MGVVKGIYHWETINRGHRLNMATTKIKITCSGSGTVAVDDLENFQGNLKEISQDNLDKLKRVIVSHGFSFPVFVWGKKILDGHHRIKAIKELLEEGYTIDKLPIIEIEAKNKKEAGEKLLLLNSQYASITGDGIRDFIGDFDINLSEFYPDLELPDIDLELFSVSKKMDMDFGGEIENDGDDLKKIIIYCTEDIVKDIAGQVADIKDKFPGIVYKVQDA